MADKKISELPTITGANTASGDLFVIVDVDANETKKITRDELTNALELTDFDNIDINGGTIDGTPIGGSTPAAGTFTTLTANGNVVLGDAATDTVTVTADVASDLIPSADGSFDLGASGAEWQDLFIDGTANIDSLVADTADINGGTIDGVTIGGASAGAGTFTTLNTTGTVIFNEAGANVDFRVEGDTDANLLVVDASADAVGIGTASPSSKLHVFNSSSGVVATISGPNAYDAETGILLSSGRAKISGVIDPAPGGTPGASLRFFTHSLNGSLIERMRLLSNGDFQLYEDTGTTPKLFWDASAESLGIGTVTPAKQLHVYGSNATAFLDAATSSFYPQLQIGGAGTPVFSIDINLATPTTNGTLIRTQGGAYPLRFGTNTTERLRIDSSGNVGIGTTSPQQLLHLSALNPGAKIRLEMSQTGVASDDVTGEIEFYHNDLSGAGVNANIKGICTNSVGAGALTFGTGTTSATERLRIDSSGNVGIGTTSPNSYADHTALTINGTSFSRQDFETGGTLRSFIGSSSSEFFLGSATAIPFVAYTGGTERARIDSSGNLLVGTTSANGSTSNGKPVVAGAFRSLNGTLTSLANGTAYTMFTASADFATWMVNVHANASNAIYSETAIVQINNSSVRVDIISAGSGVAISNSGLDIQVTQTSGTTQAELVWSAIRMA